MPSPPSPDASGSAFLDWASSAGVVTSAAFLVEPTAAEGFGAVAGERVSVGDILVTVPRASALAVFSLEEEMRQTTASLAQSHALAYAACRVAAAPRGREPWVALWPATPVGTWGVEGDSWRAFDGDAFRELRRLHEEGEAAARAAYETLPPDISWERFKLGVSIVTSRAADLVVSGERQPVLLPVIDLCNHRRGGEHNCAIVFEDDAQTTLTSPRHIRTPVYLSLPHLTPP
mmetsp:Transcript_27204/g.86604  ORF Transcript_27204/g.86604 Transcript_27204/m.86604 type:complete len:232 (+) Transcript_27204:99-794(+)